MAYNEHVQYNGGACEMIVFLMVTISWFISTLPFLIPYQVYLSFQGHNGGPKLSIEHRVMVFIFVYYLTGVLSFTGIPSLMDILQNSFGIITSKGLVFPSHEINLVLFYWFAGGIRPYLENIVLFMPLGLMPPLIWRPYETLWKTALCGIAFSLLIEMSQLFNERVTDIDDLLMNTLGTLIGWAIFRLLKNNVSKLRQRICVLRNTAEKTPLFLRNEACLYMAIAFAGMFFVFSPFLRSLIYPLLGIIII